MKKLLVLFLILGLTSVGVFAGDTTSFDITTTVESFVGVGTFDSTSAAAIDGIPAFVLATEDISDYEFDESIGFDFEYVRKLVAISNDNFLLEYKADPMATTGADTTIDYAVKLVEGTNNVTYATDIDSGYKTILTSSTVAFTFLKVYDIEIQVDDDSYYNAPVGDYSGTITFQISAL